MVDISLQPINRQPYGLLGGLDIKSYGLNPKRLVEQLQATFETRDLYTQGAMQRISSAVTGIVAVNTYLPTTPLQVPIGKLWFVLQIAFTGLVPAATTVKAAPQIQDPDGTYVRHSSTPGTGTAGDLFVSVLDGPLVMFAGQQAVVTVQSFNTIGPMTGQLLLRRLEVDA
jgi:hypothetical protein